MMDALDEQSDGGRHLCAKSWIQRTKITTDDAALSGVESSAGGAVVLVA